MSPIGWIITAALIVAFLYCIFVVFMSMVEATKEWPFIFAVAAWVAAFSFPLLFIVVALFAEEVNKFVLDALKER